MRKLDLGLTRGRLFEPCNIVFFSARYNGGFDKIQGEKAFKMLLAKYEILSGTVELSKGGEASLVIGDSPEILEFSSCKYDVLMKSLPAFLDFSENLFRFYITTDNHLVILAHTLVADSKSLFRLAQDFISFYEHKALSVEPAVLELFSNVKTLPVESGSPLTDKLSANLDEKWNKKPVSAQLNDYKKMLQEYKNSFSRVECCSASLSAETLSSLKDYCEKNNLDISGAVAFCVYKELLKNYKGEKKSQKLVLTTDRRLFFKNYGDYSVGAFDGTVEISLDKKLSSKLLAEQIKDFQRDYYKGMTSVFRSYYDDMLFMKLIPEFCDASYLYAVGLNKNKGAQNLCENYGALNKKLCRFSFLNADQAYWKSLTAFENIIFFDCFKMQYETSVSLVMKGGEATVSLLYRPQGVSSENAKKSLENAVKMIEKLI